MALDYLPTGTRTRHEPKDALVRMGLAQRATARPENGAVDRRLVSLKAGKICLGV